MKRKRFPNDRSLPDDSPEMAKAIATLKARGVSFIRPTRFQLKIGEWNYYPDNGTIVHDHNKGKERKRGLSALLALLGHDTADHPPKIDSSNPRAPSNQLIILADLIRPSDNK